MWNIIRKGKGGCLRRGLPMERRTPECLWQRELQTMNFDTIVGIQDLAKVKFYPQELSRAARRVVVTGCQKRRKEGNERRYRWQQKRKEWKQGVWSYPVVSGAMHPCVNVTYHQTQGAIKGGKGKVRKVRYETAASWIDSWLTPWFPCLLLEFG